MTVYVDEAIFPYRNDLYCHMWSADEDELHYMAIRLKLKRSWFQRKHGFNHYDLSSGKRMQAIKLGCEAISCQEMVILKNEANKTVNDI